MKRRESYIESMGVYPAEYSKPEEVCHATERSIPSGAATN